jgi:hypothetical protein
LWTKKRTRSFLTLIKLLFLKKKVDKKFTTITVTRELSYKIRKYGLDNNMKTSEVLEKAIFKLYEPDFNSLYEMADRDLGLKPKPKAKAVVKAKAKAVVKTKGHVPQKNKN